MLTSACPVLVGEQIKLEIECAFEFQISFFTNYINIGGCLQPETQRVWKV